jgi:hypothetical protein
MLEEDILRKQRKRLAAIDDCTRLLVLKIFDQFN